MNTIRNLMRFGVLHVVVHSILLLTAVHAESADMSSIDDMKSVEYGERLIPVPQQNAAVRIMLKELPEDFRQQLAYRLHDVLSEDLRGQLSDANVALWPAGENNPDILSISLSRDGEEEKGRPILIVCSANALRLVLPPPKTDDEHEMNLGRYFEKLTSEAMRLSGEFRVPAHAKYHIEISWPTEFKPGMRFSTDPDRPLIAVLHWSQRVDFVVDDNMNLHILTYWPIAQRAQLRNQETWFPDMLREQLRRQE